jgi:xanthine/CO dehydrogenase XdhC/CoxF family maturation factor
MQAIADFRALSDNDGVTDLERILALWRKLESSGADYVLATVVRVEGPSYRKPGSLMMLTADGRRAGTVSGGCLEAEVASRAWWLTADGPTIQRYSTADDDGERPFGSGCGGVIFLLLERRATAGPLLAALEQAFQRRIPIGVATVLDGEQIGRRAFASIDSGAAEGLTDEAAFNAMGDDPLRVLADRALTSRASFERQIMIQGAEARAWAHYRPARPGLWIFGAGDDALPLQRLASELGWHVSVADGRSHLATHERFQLADAVRVLRMKGWPDSPTEGPSTLFGDLKPEDAAVVMTHSFEQDSKILASLLSLAALPAYIGVLGPQRRTRELLAEATVLLGLPASGASMQVEQWLNCVHAPTGLDLGADSPETIALSVVAEVQKFRASATALPLRQVRAAQVGIAS